MVSRGYLNQSLYKEKKHEIFLESYLNVGKGLVQVSNFPLGYE